MQLLSDLGDGIFSYREEIKQFFPPPHAGFSYSLSFFFLHRLLIVQA